VRAAGSVVDNPDDPMGSGAAGGDAQFGDTFIIDGGALNGTQGQSTFLVGIGGGGLSAKAGDDITTPFPAAGARFESRISIEADGINNGSFFYNRFGSIDDGPNLPPFNDGETTGDLFGTFDFIFGQPINLNVQGIASIQVQGEGQASAQFMNTIEWGGFTSVLAGGSPVSNYSVISDSGVDWSQAVQAPALVPIPPALYLFGSGILGLISIARRKKTT